MEDADFSLGHLDIKTRIHSISMGGSIFSSPCVSNGIVFFGCNDSYVYALDFDGNKLWSYKTGDCIFSSPTEYNDCIVIGSNDGFLYSFSKNGELLWRINTGNKVYSNPLIVNGIVYFGSNDGTFHAVSVEDGKELWKYYHSSDIFWASASAVNGTIISGHMSGVTFCISAEGELLWKHITSSHSVQTPLVIDKKHNELCSFHKRSFHSFPKGEGCKAFFGSGDEFFYSVSCNNGKTDWKFHSGYMGGSSPTFYNGKIIFGSYNGNIYALDVEGRLRWKFKAGNRIVPSPICHNDVVYFGSSDHNLYALETNTGRLAWRFLTDGEILSSPVIAGDVLIFASWDCGVRAIDLKTNELLWKFRTSIPTPSFIAKPTMIGQGEIQNQSKLFFEEAKTIIGHKVEKQYSVQTGELTNTFYGSPVSGNKKKTAYDFGSEPGKYNG
jgi:eukaryotic-like serine/threonine-protein kinase